jgi:RHS repeat-associated protein
VVSKYGYDVYGERTAAAEGMATDWGFTGRKHDGAERLYYRARYLDALNARWMSADPFIHTPFSHELRIKIAAGRNGRPELDYSYVAGNPAVRKDPLGLLSLWAGNSEYVSYSV